MQVLYVLFNFEDWENIIHFGIFFASIGKRKCLEIRARIPRHQV